MRRRQAVGGTQHDHLDRRAYSWGRVGVSCLLQLILLVWVGTAGAQTIRPKQVLVSDGTGSVLKMPSMTVAQRDASSHRNGETIYCSDCPTPGVFFYFAGSWHASGAGGAGDVTHTGGLTLNALILGNVSADITALGSLGTTTTVLHGNAAGAPSFGAVVSADLNITTTSCTNQVVTALSAGGVGTCTSVTNAMLAGSIAASKLVGTDIATVGTITAGVWNGTAVTAAFGGTGQTTYTKGDLLVASAATTLTKLGVGTDTQVLVADATQATGVKWAAAGAGTVTNIATTSPITGGPITGTGTLACATCTTNAAALTANALVIGGGSQATAALGSLGTTTTVLHGNAAGAPTFGAVSLTADVSGTLPVANGGTGATTLTIHGVLVGATTGPIVATAAGATGTVLAGTTGADPAFTATPTVTSVTTSGQGAVVIGPYGAGVGNTGEIRILELAANGTNYRGFKAPDALTGNLIWTLPAADGTSGQCILTDGAGILSWGACSGGGSGLTSLNGLTAATQTFANDTNVTMVSASSTHTITWAGTLAVARGGLGVGTLTANGVLLGNTTSAVTATAAGATGTVLAGTTSSAPVFTATPTVTAVRFLETGGGTDYVAFTAPAAIASSVTWTLPSADGTNLQCITTTGSGVLQFSTCSAGAAPADPTFLTLSLSSGLSAERVLTAGTAITLTDGGANSTLTVACPTCVTGSGALGNATYWTSASAVAAQATIIHAAAHGFLTSATAAANKTALNAAIAACNTAGGCKLLLPGGASVYNINPGLTAFTVAAVVEGVGAFSSENSGTSLVVSGAGTLFTITSKPVWFKYFLVRGGTTAFAFSGVNGGGAVGLFIGAMGTGFSFADSNGWVVRDSVMTGTTTAAFSITGSGVGDGGDATITTTTITTAGGRAVLWTGGGGLRFVNNKTLGTGGGASPILDYNGAAGTVTGDLIVTNNSLEGPATYAISMQSAGTTLSKNIIANNQICTGTTGSIFIGAIVSDTSIVNNQLGCGSAGITYINITNGTGIYAAGNEIAGNGGANVGIAVAAAATRVTLGPNGFNNTDTNLTNASTTTVIQGNMLVSFASLAGNVAVDGSTVYCSNCVLNTGANTNAVCAGSGSGSKATRYSGAWRCE